LGWFLAWPLHAPVRLAVRCWRSGSDVERVMMVCAALCALVLLLACLNGCSSSGGVDVPDASAVTTTESARLRCVSPSTSYCSPVEWAVTCTNDPAGIVPSFCRADGGTHLGLQTYEFCCAVSL
jgi:hypothetical protein